MELPKNPVARFLVATGVIPPNLNLKHDPTRRENWAGTSSTSFKDRNLLTSPPNTSTERKMNALSQAVKEAKTVHVRTDTSCSFNAEIHTPGGNPEDTLYVHTSAIKSDIGAVYQDSKSKRHLVRLGGAATMKEIADHLNHQGYTLPAWISNSKASLAGALHSHGTSLGGPALLADMVESLTIMNGEGELIVLSREDLKKAGRLTLGALGIVWEVTLRVERQYQMKCTEEEMTLSEFIQEKKTPKKDSRTWSLIMFPGGGKEPRVIVRRFTKLDLDASVPASDKLIYGMVELDSLTEKVPLRLLAEIHGFIEGNFNPASAIVKGILHTINYAVQARIHPKRAIVGRPDHVSFVDVDCLQGMGGRDYSIGVPYSEGPEAIKAIEKLFKEEGSLLAINVREVSAPDEGEGCAFAINNTPNREPVLVFEFIVASGTDHSDKMGKRLWETLKPLGGRRHTGKNLTAPFDELSQEEIQAFQALKKNCDPRGKFNNKLYESLVS